MTLAPINIIHQVPVLDNPQKTREFIVAVCPSILGNSKIE